jgi:RNA polymerase sigma-70 factor (ECF subfamily)
VFLPPEASKEDRELVLRARRGDAEARARLLERWRPRLLARIRTMLGERARRHAESADLLQGTLAKALERIDAESFANEDHVLRWMTAVARNDIRDLAGRQRERAFESLSESWHASAHPDSSTPSPVSAADREERLMHLMEALERLEEGERRAIELRDLEGLTFPEIGARLGWSDDRARLTHLRALSRLGQLVGRPPR